MYPKIFIEQFWNGGIQRADEPIRRNDLFVCMPFSKSDTDEFSQKYKIIQEVGGKVQLEVNRADTRHDAHIKEDRIWDGIANSRILLFDLSDEPRIKGSSSEEKNSLANQNVCFELGFATVIRESEDILIIYKKSDKSKLPFNIDHFNRFEYSNDNELKKQLKKKLKDMLKQQDWSKSRFVKYTTNLLDMGCFCLINYLTNHPNHKDKPDYPYNSFKITHDLIKAIENKGGNAHTSVLRLLELGLIWTNHDFKKNNELELKYYWTNFGKAISRHVKKQS